MNKIKYFLCKRQSAFSLVLVLIILLVASLFISVSFYLVENYTSISFRQTARLGAYNMAVSSVEAMKAELETQLDEGKLPIAKCSLAKPFMNGWITSSDLVDSDGDGYPFDGLIAATSGWIGAKSYSYRNMSADVFVYFLSYKAKSDVGYIKDIPPQYSAKVFIAEDGESEKEVNYDGGNSSHVVYHYMIRSYVIDRYGRKYNVEQVVRKGL